MGILLLVPFLLIRFGLLFLLDKGAVGRAAYFAPMVHKERFAYWGYQLSTLAIFVVLFFLPVHLVPKRYFYIGVVIYIAGCILLAFSVVYFAAPNEKGINQKGLYAISRNPMYLAYFIFFMACVLLTQSLVLLGLVLLFQITGHWIILAEERWCTKMFGEEYQQYQKRVRRYI